MHEVLLASASVLSAAEESGAHEGTVWGIAPGYFGIVAGLLFLVMFLVTISFSGRGIERDELSAKHLGADEAQAIADYKAKRGH